MMNTIKKLCIFAGYLGVIALFLLPFSSCTKTEYVEGVPYAARIDSIIPHAGNGTVDFDVYISSFQIETVRIYWNGRQDLKEINIGGITGVYRVTVEGLDAIPYDFTVYSYDKFRHESLPVKTSVTVYDDAYLASLFNRSVIKAAYFAGTLTINWSTPASGEIRTEVVYTNQEGQETVREVPTDEIYTEIIDINNWEDGFDIKTYIMPAPTALDIYIAETEYRDIVLENARPGKVWDDCESLTGWSGMGLTLDGTNPREGSYCIQASGQANIIFVKTFPSPFDTEVSRADGYIAFSLYVEDATALGTPRPDWKQCTLTFTSNGGTGNSNQLRILFSPHSPPIANNPSNFFVYTLVSGWNEIEVKLTDCIPSDDSSEANLSALNYLQLNCGTMTKATKLKIDNIRFYEK
jgi:hypothetical protein